MQVDRQGTDQDLHGSAEGVRQHLLAELSYQEGLVRFIENHDEPRAAAAFPGGRSRAAAVAILTLPGGRLLHEGQFEGWRVRLPVFLARRPAEPVDHDLAAFYGRLLKVTSRDLVRNGAWRLCECSGWPDNQSNRNILAWCWVKDSERALVVVNYGDAPAQGLVRVPWDELRAAQWRLDDQLAGDVYDRDGNEMRDRGLYVDLAPWQSHIFDMRVQ